MRNESRVRKILPVNLMLEGRPCLVVGSGQIAARKVSHLLAAGAAVTVVGPQPSDEILGWVAQGRIEYRPRPFRSSDLKGQWIVLAATDSFKVNGEVLQLCQRKGILCSAADANWTKADFLVPATLRRPHITLTLSTGGESCRRARLIKDYMARHIDMLRSADLMVVSIEQPRRGAKRAVLELGAVLQQIWGIHEFVIVNRRDRLEVLAVLSAWTIVASKLLRDSVQTRFPGRCCIQEGPAAVEYVAEKLCRDLRLTDRPRGSRKVRPPAELSGGGLFMEGEPRVSRVDRGDILRAALHESTQAGWAGVMMKEWIEASFRLVGETRESLTKALKSGFSKRGGEYQRQYERIIRSI